MEPFILGVCVEIPFIAVKMIFEGSQRKGSLRRGPPTPDTGRGIQPPRPLPSPPSPGPTREQECWGGISPKKVCVTPHGS